MRGMREIPADIMSVSQLTRRIKGLLEAEINYVWVAGEISNYRVSPTGHAYFVLKDADSQIDAVMFRGKLLYLRFEPENGLEVLLHGLVSVYEKRGSYQIVCDDMQPKGLGALQLAFEKLKKRLQAEGLFDEDRKKPLPLLPRRIGIVTSPTGAAIRDILHVIHRRFANVHILLFPARVQGQEAAAEIVEGIQVLNALGVDVMIVGRGGGSLEDLWPFNEEIVVRAVAASRTPVISAVGHEIDFTLCDFAADVRAPTPSAAAELVVREQQALSEKVALLKQRLAKSLRAEMEGFRYRLSLAQSSFVFQRPQEMIRQRRQHSDELRIRLEAGMAECTSGLRLRLDRASRALALLSPANQLRRAAERLGAARIRLVQSAGNAVARFHARLRPLHARLEALSPLAILSRGYALVWKQPKNELVREAGQLASGDAVKIRLGRGGASARIETIEEEAHG